MEHSALHSSGPILSRIISGAWRWNLPETEIEKLINARGSKRENARVTE